MLMCLLYVTSTSNPRYYYYIVGWHGPEQAFTSRSTAHATSTTSIWHHISWSPCQSNLFNLIVSLTQPSRAGWGRGLPIVGFLNCGPTCKANSNALSIYGCTLLPNTKTCIHSTPSVLLPPSWFIGPLCSLCQILTKDLTNKMLMHVKKNYLIGFVFEHSFQKYNVWWHA